MSGLGTSTSSDIRTDYMRLLITQLQNQNPLEPMDNNQMATQLTQLSQLEQLENMQSAFQRVLVAEQTSQATELIGKEISFFPAGGAERSSGWVDQVELVDGEIKLVVGSHRVSMDEVRSIGNISRPADPRNQAVELIGKEVVFYPAEGQDAVTGIVQRVKFADGGPQLIVGVEREQPAEDGTKVILSTHTLGLDEVQPVVQGAQADHRADARAYVGREVTFNAGAGLGEAIGTVDSVRVLPNGQVQLVVGTQVIDWSDVLFLQ